MIAYHLRQSFRPGEISPEEANRLGRELAQRFTKGNHAYIVCTHIDKTHTDYQKARDEMRSLQTAKANVDRILGEEALSVERESEKEGR